MSGPYFEAIGGSYRTSWDEPESLVIEFDLLRSERSGELTGEVSIFAVPNGLSQHLHTARMNLSSTRSRAEVARHVAARSSGHHPDWAGALEVACLRTITAYRAGEPATLLADIKRPEDAGLLVPPLALGRLPTMIFGDGGTGKTELALGLAVTIETGRSDILGLAPEARRRVGWLDYEFDGWELRERARALAGEPIPSIVYIPCRRPLVEDVDRIRRIIRQRNLGYLVVDSVGLGCDGPPEAAEVANRFLGAVRQLERGALLIAHTTKTDDGERPFGSTFWHNGCRLTWYAKRQQEIASSTLTVGLFNRKSNVGPLAAPLGFEIAFGDEQTTIRRTDLADAPDLASQLPLRLRIAHELRGGARTMAEIAAALDVPVDSVKKALSRGEGSQFVRIPGDGQIYRWGLAHAA